LSLKYINQEVFRVETMTQDRKMKMYTTVDHDLMRISLEFYRLY